MNVVGGVEKLLGNAGNDNSQLNPVALAAFNAKPRAAERSEAAGTSRRRGLLTILARRDSR